MIYILCALTFCNLLILYFVWYDLWRQDQKDEHNKRYDAYVAHIKNRRDREQIY